MGRPRAFDYEEARRLRREGLSYVEIGRRLGVSANSAAKACDPVFRRRQPDKPPECCGCARKRIAAERRQKKAST